MKKQIYLIKKMAYVVMAALVFASCQDIDTPPFGDFEIDPSVVKIISPVEGSAIKVFEDLTSIDIEIEVNDDNLVSEISIALDGTEIVKFDNFNNPRRISETYTYTGLANGEHTLTVTSTDINGKSTTAEANFTKEPPYVAEFDGEVLYMPFDGDYRDLIGFELADEVGSPGFAESGFAGASAYKGTTDAYLTFPSEGLLSNEFSATFWYKVNANPDRAGLLVIGNDIPENRNQGFRLFREGNATEQTIKLNVGTGAAESWNDGGVIDVAAGEWVHIAFTISQTESKIYFNGIEMNTGAMDGPIDWTGVGSLAIGSGGDTFNYWGHNSDSSEMDELRIFNKALSPAEISSMVSADPYIPQYPGESFYMPFDGGFVNLFDNMSATQVGSPQITGDDTYEGSGAYEGATDSYLTYPTDGLTTPEFSASMWYKLNNDPDRGGVLTIGPEDTANAGFPDTQNLRTNGLRFFRENGDDGNQRFKLNVGTGAGEAWVDGGVDADVDPTTGEWVHLAFTISNTDAIVYINGASVAQTTITGIDWTGCDIISIMSGAPRFTEWGHLSDNSNLDELRFFNKALSTEEVAAVFGGDVTLPFFGATLYMPFDADNINKSNNVAATTVGTTGFSGEAKVGDNAFLGSVDSYLTYPTADLTGESFSAAMWYKLDVSPDRAGILVAGPEDTDNAGFPDTQNLRTSGFRLFRENGEDGFQRFKLNVGNGTGESWIDGGVDADVPNDAGWIHLAFTISPTKAIVYIDGAVVKEEAITGVDWAGCDLLSIMSGAARFTEWGHLSDLSYLDELYLFDRELTQEEIQTIMDE
ncbi:hypothetical protein GCM10023314_30340 [Algibacter agarivorans]|uniref:Concanavalin A-like lectin/glucanases superfamily protein n=1 Tax=Algibacter agarivorans TaxID=1109741 RepID=A0ABP9GW18_9FLAO